MNPKISVVVPCYNQAQYLDECLQSVLDQTYQNWECIIVNDGSPDNTEQVAQKWTAKDSRFKYLKKENGGLSSARNAGIEMARGEWILPLDSDDKIGGIYLELAEKEFLKSYEIIYCRGRFFETSHDEFATKPFSLLEIAKGNMIFCSAFFKKESWKRVSGYDLHMKYGYEDWELWINILKNNPKVYKINEFCFFYRRRENTMVTKIALNQEKSRYTLNYVFSKHHEFFQRAFQELKEENDGLKKKMNTLEKTIRSNFFLRVQSKVARIKNNYLE